MSLKNDYNNLCPIFNWNTKSGGVLFPFFVQPTSADYVDLDGSLLLANDPYNGVKIDNGKIVLNDLPGLGIIQK